MARERILAVAVAFLVRLTVLILTSSPSAAQTAVNLDNGFKPYGSYAGSNLDSVSLLDGNFLLHAPLIPTYPQRGGKLDIHLLLYVSSHSWTSRCIATSSQGYPGNCYWNYGGNGVAFEYTAGMILHRSLIRETSPQSGTSYSVNGYSLTTWDGATHGLKSLSGMLSFETIDATGYRVDVSNPDVNYGIPQNYVITDRHGTQYQGSFDTARCGKPAIAPPYSPGGRPMATFDTWTTGPQICEEDSNLQQIVDSNGNGMVVTSDIAGAVTDTMGRPTWPLQNAVTTNDPGGCVNTAPFASAAVMSYTTPNGGSAQIKVCTGTVTLQTSFGVANTAEVQNSGGLAATSVQQITTIVLGDNSKWVFTYDSYGYMTHISLPTGGSISYTWTTLYAPFTSNGATRAIATRTLDDNNGNVSTWTYHWGTVQSDGSLTNRVTDPKGNDTVHVFTLLAPGRRYETSTQFYEGPQSSGNLLKQADTTYARAMAVGSFSGGVANPVPTDIKTTLLPSGKVSLVHKDYDQGPGGNGYSLGNVTVEKEYDWGPGRPGALLRETDTSYQWQADSRYLAANLLDLPASVIIKDGSGCTLGKTDYIYDEFPLQSSQLGTAQQLWAPPGPVRGNQTSISKYLWTLASGSCAAVPATASVVSHARWYDSGELYQTTDPLGHTTTHFYDAAYAGTYPTITCNALNQCASATYDYGTGLLASFTDANGSTQASGTTQGDPAHTILYQYNDPLWRMTSAQMPPAASRDTRPQTTFTYPNTNEVDQSKSITASVNDQSSRLFDGLGRQIRTQHVTPSGNAAVDTSYDAVGNVYTVSNPYFSVNDSTYGLTQSDYDALGRVIRTTRQDGSASTADYSGGDNCVTSADEAGKQRRMCSDALGRLISVDEPGDSNASTSPVPASGGTQATGSVTINGTEQSTQIPDPNGGGGAGGLGGGGNCDPGLNCSGTGDGSGGGGSGTITVFDAGSVSLTINQRTYTASFSSVTDTPGTIATALAAAINADSSLGVKATASNGTVSLVSIAASSSGSFSLVTPYTWDNVHFPRSSFVSSITGLNSGTNGPAIFGGHAYTTLYSYDALDNLLQVTQQGGTTNQSLWRVRTFTYDSFSRLLTASNPESGIIQYAYDADSNLISKTDARGITINYSPADSPIDALHRVTKKTFSNGDTPELFRYDSSNDPTWAAGSSVGKLVRAYKSGGHWFRYDALGRTTATWQCLPSDCVTGAGVSASYDLSGNLTSLVYPSGRTVTFSYNSGNQLNQAQFTQWTQAGSPTLTPYTYWKAFDNNFYATGTPKSWILGNGVTESVVLNQRLQLQQQSVSNPTIHTLMDHAFSYGMQNNGNILSIADQLNPARTQNFTYDPLNRLATATESRWGLNFGYDPWGNRLQQNLTAGAAGTSQLTVDNRNRIQGAPPNCTAANAYCYDAAGGMLNDGFHQYTYNAENQIVQVDNGASNYTYNAEGQRLRKDTATGSIEYVYFGGNVIAEKNVSNGDWTDYIFINGKRIAQAFSFENRVRIYGTSSCTSCSGQWAFFAFPSNAGGLNSYVVKPGDKLFLRQTQVGNVHVGMGLNFTDGSSSWGLADQDGQPPSSDGLGLNGAWHSRTIDLTPRQGRTISLVYLYVTPFGSGNWSGYFNNLALVSSDGTVYPLYGQQSSVNFTKDSSAAVTALNFEVNHDAYAGPYAFSVHYYHGDQIGSSRLMTTGEGWPISQSTFLPFGEEYNPQISSNNYKFTGKERDLESGLDYFGARYYSNGLGRFITPDWSATPVPIPYVDLNDPQSINQYSYVRNLPTVKTDADGHCGDSENSPCSANLSVTQVTNIVFNETQSLSGNDVTLSDARQSIAHAIINGDNAKGDNRPIAASDKVSPANQQTQVYKDTHSDVQCACSEAAEGVDPTDGAQNFNLRPNKSTAPFQKLDIQTQSGPFKNSFPGKDLPKGKPVYVNTYKPLPATLKPPKSPPPSKSPVPKPPPKKQPE